MRPRTIPPTVVIAFLLCVLFGGGFLLDGDRDGLEGAIRPGTANLGLIGG